ncbi:MAG: glycosyltransferase family 2 protein [Lachnospiraceae bacterium]|nr:glycosyltransferase family 2 protein [Lachnospiraceae bacterium]
MDISLCMIMKNEEKNLAKCLDAVKDCGFELVLVDTGSTDETVSIAKRYTDTVHHFDWIGDFAAARNYSLSLASNDWVLVLDCDEIITKIDPDALCRIMKLPEQCIGMISRRNHYDNNGVASVYTDGVERFFNRKVFHYEGIIHEQVRPMRLYAIPDCGIYHDTGIVCEHSGYEGTFEERLAKKKRNEELLLKQLEKDPGDPYIWFQLGQCHNGFDDEKAAYYYGKGLECDVDPELEYVQMMIIAYGYALTHLNRFEEALSIANVYDEFATSADFVVMMGIVYLRTGRLMEALKEFLKATTMEVSHVEGANSFIPFYNMGCISELLDDRDNAISFFRKCGDYPPALEKLKELS